MLVVICLQDTNKNSILSNSWTAFFMELICNKKIFIIKIDFETENYTI